MIVPDDLYFCRECNHAIHKIQYENIGYNFMCGNCGLSDVLSHYTYDSVFHWKLMNGEYVQIYQDKLPIPRLNKEQYDW